MCYRPRRRPGVVDRTRPPPGPPTTVHQGETIVRKNHWYLLAAGVALAGMVACGGGAEKTTSDGDAGVGDAPAPAGVAIGKPARDGKFEFTVTKVDCSKTKIGSGPLTQTAQGKFCLVNVTVKNIGDQAQLFDAGSQKTLDSKGTQYDADSGAALYVNKNSETFLNNINPGNQVKGVLPFDVPKTVTITAVELHDSPFSDGIKIAVK
jgi:hypothetical protein